MDIKRLILLYLLSVYGLCGQQFVYAQSPSFADLTQGFHEPPEEAKPWVYWYWMRSAVTREGIKADLEAMKAQGIGGAYLMTVRGTADPPYISPPIVPLSTEWWEMVRFAIAEAARVGIKLAMTSCDGWALAGGPWITPEWSMQRVVWTKTEVNEGDVDVVLSTPKAYQNYYRDIAVYAYPSPVQGEEALQAIPKITSSTGVDVQYLAETENQKDFTSKTNCWIQFAFEQPFSARSLVIRANKNYQAMRLVLAVSNDGKHFKSIGRLEAPRHGWQDMDEPMTYSIGQIKARYFRLLFDKTGSEPGSEELDYAKWAPELSVRGITFSAEPKIHQFEGKSGAVWRVSKRTTEEQLPDRLCVPRNHLLNISKYVTVDGRLHWKVPPGKWTILRMGHTSTGHQNAAAGGATGLECDKFNPEAARVQFNGWFAKALAQNSEMQLRQIIRMFHVDSWECGSQNWSTVFAAEFRKRRGYDILDYLPVMAGVPIQSADSSERVLSDIRQTISELVTDNFFGTLSKLAHEKDCSFSAEATAPTMVSDGMLYFDQVDIPMGEFWYRSPTHDKPNDILDAVSGGHVYGKNIIQAEAFTELRLLWDEHPAMLKTLTDRSFAMGINRYVMHVNTHNPWMDRKPGMTLDGIGVYFQRDQTWWKPGRACIDYIRRCQFMLQQGRPVVDVAVFTGEETPRRAVLPEKLVNILPGIVGQQRVEQEKERLNNEGIPLRTISEGFPASANMAYPENWIDPLRGYAYDSFNPDVLLRLAKVNNGRIELPDGASYGVLVVPGTQSLSPDGIMSVKIAEKLLELAKSGATIILGELPQQITGLQDNASRLKQIIRELATTSGLKVFSGVYQDRNFNQLNMQRDIICTDQKGRAATGIAWTHRASTDYDIYFVANQQEEQRIVNLSLRVSEGSPQLWDPLTATIRDAGTWKRVGGRTVLPLQLDAHGSLFVVVKHDDDHIAQKNTNWPIAKLLMDLTKPWKITFDPAYGGPAQPVVLNTLQDWRTHADSAIKYYSGTALYTQQFDWKNNTASDNIWLDVGRVANLAEVYVNGVNCGVAWTAPYRVNISKALKPGQNEVKIAVTNTWANRLIGDADLPEAKRFTWTIKSPVDMKNRKLLPAGLFGPVSIINLQY
ncbi:glycosyl hydrolase [Olivibacter ginsenosidimutans]|uniref:Glycosyl hydrolase n=1 Tax=Olivibacter ginsenosidimutans TaxID=1176537 RepID=A0ABP9AFT4_9SPHI